MVTDSIIQQLADEAANRYVKEKIPLNDSIVKLAKDERLSPEAVARVVERANTGVQVCLFSEFGPKETFEFPLASTKEILSSLNPDVVDGYQEKPSQDLTEKEGAPPKLASWSQDISNSDWNPNHMTVHQLAMRSRDTFDMAKSEMRSMVIESEGKLEKIASDFVGMCKQEIASGDWTARELAENLSYFRPQARTVACSLIKKANDQCHHTRPVDSAEGFEETPPSFLVNEGNSRPVKVIDSNHSLIITLDTLVDQAREADCLNRGLGIIEDKARYLQTQVKDMLSREYEKEVR